MRVEDADRVRVLSDTARAMASGDPRLAVGLLRDALAYSSGLRGVSVEDVESAIASLESRRRILLSEIAEAIRREPAALANQASCSGCGDAHRVEVGDRTDPCTRCPLPCEGCRDRTGGNPGAYCASAPCACTCHGVRP